MIVRELTAVVLLAGSLAACVSTMPPERLHPRGPTAAGPGVDFSGTYCFDPVTSVRAFERKVQDIPFLRLDRVAAGAEIEVEHQPGESIRFSFRGADGELERSEVVVHGRGVHWRGGRLIVPPPPKYEGARLGVGVSRQESTIYRLRDGRLILSNVSAEAGLAFLFLPFRERYEVVVELRPEPEGRGCPGALPSSASGEGDRPRAARLSQAP